MKITLLQVLVIVITGFTTKNMASYAEPNEVRQIPALEEEFSCLSSGPKILTTCNAEFNVILKGIDFTQTYRASTDDVSTIASWLAPEGLPTSECCNLAAQFNTYSCQCDMILGRLLPQVGVAMPALLSVFDVMEQTCGSFKIRVCQ